jgi:hypothetical protein
MVHWDMMQRRSLLWTTAGAMALACCLAGVCQVWAFSEMRTEGRNRVVLGAPCELNQETNLAIRSRQGVRSKPSADSILVARSSRADVARRPVELRAPAHHVASASSRGQSEAAHNSISDEFSTTSSDLSAMSLLAPGEQTRQSASREPAGSSEGKPLELLPTEILVPGYSIPPEFARPADVHGPQDIATPAYPSAPGYPSTPPYPAAPTDVTVGERDAALPESNSAADESSPADTEFDPGVRAGNVATEPDIAAVDSGITATDAADAVGSGADSRSETATTETIDTETSDTKSSSTETQTADSPTTESVDESDALSWPAFPAESSTARTPESPEQSEVASPSETPLPRSRIMADARLLTDVARMARPHVEQGFSLAGRQAHFAARSEFIQALRSVAQSYDTVGGTSYHSRALAEGLRALEEANDFIPSGASLEAGLDLAEIVGSHRTAALKDRVDEHTTALVAIQHYYTYAQVRLADASAGDPTASWALFGLGKLYAEMGAQSALGITAATPKCIVFHQAALGSNTNNYLAANELGVLLVRYGRYQEARHVLQHSVAVCGEAASWHNLAVVHQYLGEHQLAAQAQQMGDSLKGIRTAHSELYPIRWIEPQEFNRQTAPPMNPELQRSTPSNQLARRNRSGSVR